MTSSDVFVQIEDENDNSPVFERDKYIGSVMESQKSFTQVSDGRSGGERRPLVIRANDFDAGMNGKIKYSFLENSALIYFTINENTGEVLTNRVCLIFRCMFNFIFSPSPGFKEFFTE